MGADMGVFQVSGVPTYGYDYTLPKNTHKHIEIAPPLPPALSEVIRLFMNSPLGAVYK